MTETRRHNRGPAPAPEPPPPSKSQRKRDAQALHRLGAALVKLAPSQLSKITLDDQLREAVILAQGLKPGGARKRQIQYIARLLRQTDAETVQQTMPGMPAAHTREARRRVGLEREIGSILAAGERAIEALLERYPALDRQRLRQLTRNAQRSDPGSSAHDQAVAALRRYLARHLPEP